MKQKELEKIDKRMTAILSKIKKGELPSEFFKNNPKLKTEFESLETKRKKIVREFLRHKNPSASQLNNCKKILAENEKEFHKPTISRYWQSNNMLAQENGLSRYRTAIQKLPSGLTLKSELSAIYRALVDAKRKAKFKHSDKEYYQREINRLKHALEQGLQSARNGKETNLKNGLGDAAKLTLKIYRSKNEHIAINNLTNKEKQLINNYPQYFYKKRVSVGLTREGYWLSESVEKSQKNETHSDFNKYKSVTLENLSRMFQGSVSGDNRRVLSPDLSPNDTARLGHLVFMKVKTPRGTMQIDFDGESYLGIDHRKNLWIKGKDARIKGVSLPRKGQLTEIGDLIQIDYVTAKKHIGGGKLIRFWHPLGEINKEYPKLFIDSDGFPVIIGGGYDVWKVGIVN